MKAIETIIPSFSTLKILLIGLLLSLGLALYFEFAQAQDQDQDQDQSSDVVAVQGTEQAQQEIKVPQLPAWILKFQEQIDAHPKFKEMVFKLAGDDELIAEIKKIPTSEALEEMRIVALIIALVGFLIMLIGNGDLGIFGKFLKKLVVFYFIFFSEIVLFIVYFPAVAKKILYGLIGLL